VKWLRIVLDEGHAIRNPSALQTRAIQELQAERKWVLTGKPDLVFMLLFVMFVVNKVEIAMFALNNFLVFHLYVLHLLIMATMLRTY